MLNFTQSKLCPITSFSFDFKNSVWNRVKSAYFLHLDSYTHEQVENQSGENKSFTLFIHLPPLYHENIVQ